MISKHFYRSEHTCKCGCSFDTVDKVLNDILEDVREHFNKPVLISSGCRCTYYNRKIKGKLNSQHLQGKAADIVVVGIRTKEVQKYLLNKYPDQYGIGCYQYFAHIDSRTQKARW